MDGLEKAQPYTNSFNDRLLPECSPIHKQLLMRKSNRAWKQSMQQQNQYTLDKQNRYGTALACALDLTPKLINERVNKTPLQLYDTPIWNDLMHPQKLEFKNPSPLVYEVKLQECGHGSLEDDFYLNLLAWSPAHLGPGGLVTLGVNKDTIKLFDPSNSLVSNEEQVFRDEVKIHTLASIPKLASLSWAPSSNLLAVGTKAGTVCLVDAGKPDSKHASYNLKGRHEGRVGVVRWSGPWTLTSAAKDSRVIIQDIRSKTGVTLNMQAHRQEVCGLAWDNESSYFSSSSMATYLASGGNDNLVNIWDIRMSEIGSNSSKPLTTLYEHTAAVKALAWSPHQRGLLATGGGTADRTIRFWRPYCNYPIDGTIPSKANEVSSLQTFHASSQVCAMGWSPFGSELCTTHGFTDNDIQLWSIKSGHTCHPIKAHSSRVLFMANGQGEMVDCIATGSAGDNIIRIWRIFRSYRSQQKYRLASPPNANEVEQLNPFI